MKQRSGHASTPLCCETASVRCRVHSNRHSSALSLQLREPFKPFACSRSLKESDSCGMTGWRNNCQYAITRASANGDDPAQHSSARIRKWPHGMREHSTAGILPISRPTHRILYCDKLRNSVAFLSKRPSHSLKLPVAPRSHLQLCAFLT